MMIDFFEKLLLFELRFIVLGVMTLAYFKFYVDMFPKKQETKSDAFYYWEKG